MVHITSSFYVLPIVVCAAHLLSMGVHSIEAEEEVASSLSE